MVVRIGRRRFAKGAFAALATGCTAPPGPAAPRPPVPGPLPVSPAEPLEEPVRERQFEFPDPWPPTVPLSPRVIVPPYLENPPALIHLGPERQLFVDDYLIAETTLDRVFHRPEAHPANPILVADRPWETDNGFRWAMPYSDGFLYDDRDGLFKIWYLSVKNTTCLAVSQDALRIEKPSLDIVPGTNIVSQLPRDSTSVIIDGDDHPSRRYKWFRSSGSDAGWRLEVHYSGDGMRWSDAVLASPLTPRDRLTVTDRNTVFWNPVIRRWVFSLRSHEAGFGRLRRYWDTADLAAGLDWGEPPLWVLADELDIQHRRPDANTPQLYNLDCAPYEGLLLGLFAIYSRGADARIARPKINELHCAFSRDQFHWDRSNRAPFIGVSEEPASWNWGNVQSVGGCYLLRGDELWFPVTGRTDRLEPGLANPGRVASMGIYTLRRDGFASMRAGSRGGYLITRPLVFDRTQRHLNINADAQAGDITVEILDEWLRPFPGYDQASCVPVDRNGTALRVAWRTTDELRMAGRAVRLKFHVRSAELFSFFVMR